MSTWHDTVSRRSDIRARAEGDGRFLLYNPRTDELHVLGPVEKQIFDLCDGRSIDDVVEGASPLLAPLGITDLGVAAAEVLAFLRALAERDLVEYG